MALIEEEEKGGEEEEEEEEEHQDEEEEPEWEEEGRTATAKGIKHWRVNCKIAAVFNGIKVIWLDNGTTAAKLAPAKIYLKNIFIILLIKLFFFLKRNC